MKTLITILVLSLLIACSSATEKDQQNTEETTIPAQVKDKKIPTATTAKETYLCKINGNDWAYTKASGIVSTHAKTKERTAIITFKKKLERGSESIQLYYDANSFELIQAALQFKFKKKDGKLSTCFYNTNSGKKNRHPQQTMSGSIDLSNESSASGTAETLNINMQSPRAKAELFDSDNATITMTDLKFLGVGYSDIDKLTNAFKK